MISSQFLDKFAGPPGPRRVRSLLRTVVTTESLTIGRRPGGPGPATGMLVVAPAPGSAAFTYKINAKVQNAVTPVDGFPCSVS